MIGILKDVISAADKAFCAHQCGGERGEILPQRNVSSGSWNKLLQTVLTFNLVTPPQTQCVSREENIIKIQGRGQKEGQGVNGERHKQGKLGHPGKNLCLQEKLFK